MGSSRSNSDIPMPQNCSLNLANSQTLSQNVAATALGKVMPFQPALAEATSVQPRYQKQQVLVQKSLESAATQLHYQPPHVDIEHYPVEAESTNTVAGPAIMKKSSPSTTLPKSQ